MTPSKITLKDIYDVCNRLEDKMDKRMECIETRIDELETFKDNLVGKIGLITGIVSLFGTLLMAFLKDLFKKV